ncbi:cytochrome b/b6 domain-containing protein [Sphingomonas naphthae]|uniref:Cytochrome b/b6 domain-containing protein n=1 Tax=Sphingomonas naphthae TaxID=1813468 RepID=A0ABY7TRT8_9SPHN|nr:cytochrome b/b6 domain-containing protein [Sphingomonas naphthae]WCT74559.1 cytochrome b/b6 domain-containing protein [Sphingomonas naphthae]
MEAAPQPPGEPRRTILRHRLSTRIWHWLNALTIFVMLMSGLMIFNAHPRLYWGKAGANYDRAWLMIGATPTQGRLVIGSVVIPTTGVLGRWEDKQGRTQTRAFPYWATIPSRYSLSMARRWHLAFAWVLAIGILAYIVAILANGHARRDLAPTRDELRPRHLWRDIRDHARLRFPKGEAAARYNPLQKIAYVGVIFALIPLLVLTGLTMAPGMNAAWPWLLDVFGGRQSARSIHFLCAAFIALFILVHLIMVVLAGPINELRSMITGRFRLPRA